MSSVRLFDETSARSKKASAMVDEIFCREFNGKSYDDRTLDSFYALLRDDKTSLRDLGDILNTLRLYQQRISDSANGNKHMIDTYQVTDRQSAELMVFTKELYESECKFSTTYQVMANKIDAIRQEKLAQQNMTAAVGSMKI